MRCMKSDKEYDVIVCGAGPAGFCAALAAARLGAKTVLIEKYGMPGGTLTVLGSNSIDMFVNPYRGDNRMIITGIPWEFVKKLHGKGEAFVPDMDAPFVCNQQYGVKVRPVAASALMDDMLLEAGVRLCYCQGAADVETETDADKVRVSAVVVSTKEGLKRIPAGYVIDATGDGDICAWAGNRYECGGEDGSLQPGTLRYYLSGAASPAEIADANILFRQERESGNLTEDDLLYGADFETILKYNGENRNHVMGLNSADSDSRTAAEIRARKRLCVLNDVIKRTGAPVYIAGTAPESAARESRRIMGDCRMTADDWMSCRRAADAVCYTYWHIDIHGPGDYMSKHIYLKGPETPSVPLGCMIPESLSNVLVAGRCISGDRASVSAVRVKASCMAMGQAAGTAAAIAADRNERFIRRVDLNAVKNALANSGAVVPGLTEPEKFVL